MSRVTTHQLAEKLAILDRYEHLIRIDALQPAHATPAAQQRTRRHALTRLAQPRQVLLGTLDPAAQRELSDALAGSGIDLGASHRERLPGATRDRATIIIHGTFPTQPDG
jgi:hypothetical protein